MTFTIFFSLTILYILYWISIEDIRIMLISEGKLIIFAISGLIYLLYAGLSNEKLNTINLIKNNCLYMLIIFLLMYSISTVSYKVFRTNSLGIGDIKLSSISTIWLGFEWSLISLCIAFLLSAIYYIHGKFSKKLKPFQQYPFAPFISIGIFCAWIIDKI